MIVLINLSFLLGAKQCRYNGKEYSDGTTIEKPNRNYAQCNKCTCIRGRFRRCTKLYDCELGYLPCGKEDYELLPGDCCPVCKRKGK